MKKSRHFQIATCTTYRVTGTQYVQKRRHVKRAHPVYKKKSSTDLSPSYGSADNPKVLNPELFDFQAGEETKHAAGGLVRDPRGVGAHTGLNHEVPQYPGIVCAGYHCGAAPVTAGARNALPQSLRDGGGFL